MAFPAQTAGAAGWQANDFSLEAYDHANLLYGSDARGHYPFFPRIGDQVFKTLQIPGNLPTLDELLGRPEYPMARLTDFYLSRLESAIPNVIIIHAEIEGMKYFSWFKDFLLQAKAHGIQFVKMVDIARQYLSHPEQIPVCELIQASIDGRSGTVAVQKLET